MSAKRVLSLVLAVLTIVVLVVPTVSAQSATNQIWTSSITYYTPSGTGGQLTVDYYNDLGTKYSADAITLNPHKAGSLYIGSVSSVPDGFAGSAVLSASVPIVATYVQFASGSAGGEYGRMLYNGFSAAEAADKFYVPTVLYEKFGTTSRIGVQNVEDSQSVTADLKFYAVGATSPTATKQVTIPALSSYIFSPADITGLNPGFNGSLVVDTNGTGSVVAASQETHDNGRAAYAFEGVAQGANTVYMASMLCEYRPEKQTSYYAIQNAGTGNASVEITFYDKQGNVAGTMLPKNIPQGGKESVQPCAFGVPVGTSGSAVIKSTGAPIIAIAKVAATNGLVTAFVGQSAGSENLAAPYVRWASDPAADFRAYIAVMNIGSGPAQDIKAVYYDGNGTAVATHTLATSANALGRFIKTNTDPYSAGALNATYNDFGFHPAGGAIEFQSDQPIVVVARLARNVSLGSTTMFGEDYNGVAVPAP
jgi:energy-converting hydrogenase Eha subunit A